MKMKCWFATLLLSRAMPRYSSHNSVLMPRIMSAPPVFGGTPLGMPWRSSYAAERKLLRTPALSF
ncbi:hypothetical protein D3C79_1028400 [compost metagenome]